MCPSLPVLPLGDIDLHWTDEERVMYLQRLVCGAPLPSNVIRDVNPYNVFPGDLPGNIWYFFNSEDSKTTETGYWKAIEDHRIPTNSTTSGWRTTMEFYIGQAPHGDKTDWMMYDYRINLKGLSGNNNTQDSNSLCWVFFNSIQSPYGEENYNYAGADDANGDYVHPERLNDEENSHNAHCTSRAQVANGVDENRLLAISERHLPDQRLDNPVEDLNEINDCSRGDFLELLDLTNPESRSSSSENSSCLTMSSDEYFDSLALLQDLEAGNNQDRQQNYTCNVSVSRLSTSLVVLNPESSGSATEQQVLDSKASKQLCKVGDADQGLLTNLKNGVASSSSLPAASTSERQVVGRMKKLRKKYLCFMPF